MSSEQEAIAEALDDLVISRGVALDDERLDWLAEWITARLAQAWEDGYAYRAGRNHPTIDPHGVRVGLDNPYRDTPASPSTEDA